MSEGLQSLATDIARRIASTDRRQIIGIVGAPGTGKSTVARILQSMIGEELCAVVPMDGFHLSQGAINGSELATRKGAADTFDIGGYLSILERLKRNDEEVIYAPDYRRSIEDPIAAAIAVPRQVRVVLTEGNYLLAEIGRWIEVRDYLAEAWFVETPHDIRVARLIQRHVEFGKAPEFAEEWALGSDESNAKIVEATRPRADKVILWS